MKDKSKKSTYSTTFGIDPFGVDPDFGVDPIHWLWGLPPFDTPFSGGTKKDALKQTPMVDQ